MLKLIFLVTLLYNIPQQTTAKPFDMQTCDWEYDQTPPTGGEFQQACPGYNAYGPHANGYNNLRINYLDFPPYIYADGNSGSPKGIWVDFLKDFTRRACGGSPSSAIQWIERTHTRAYDLQNYCRTNVYQCAMALPSVGYSGARTLNRNEWNLFWTNNGVALISIPGELWRKTLANFGEGVIATWPFLVLCFIAAFLAGFFLWLLDTWSNEEEFPRPYYRGICHGTWCAFVSMTTVGYGDKSPRGVLTRLFSVFWIIMGICMIAILTSLLSNSLTGALFVPDLHFPGATIGCLETVSSSRQIIESNGGIAKIAKDYLELESWMARGLIDGFAMDSRQLQYYYKTRLSKLEPIVTFKLEGIYEYNKVFGLTAHAPHASTESFRTDDPDSSQPWDDCLNRYMAVNTDRQSEMEAYYTQKMSSLMDASILQPKGDGGFTVLEPTSTFFKELMWTCFGLIIAILVFGIFYEYMRRVFFKKSANTSGNGVVQNTGYQGSGEKDGGDDKTLSKEERNIQELVEKTLRNAEKSLNETERAVHNEVMEMSRSIRREMVELKRREKKDYGL